MIVNENEQGIVCIDGKPVAEHYKERGLAIDQYRVLADPSVAMPTPACLAGLLLVIALDDVGRAWMHLQETAGYTHQTAVSTGLPLIQVASLEAGWCAFGRATWCDTEFYRLGAKAYSQCQGGH